MKLPDFINITYDPITMKSYMQCDIDRYVAYRTRCLRDDLMTTIEQNEMRTGIQLMFKIWSLVSSDPILHLERDTDYHFSLGEYRHYARHYFNLKVFAQKDTECFWFVISRYYPFTDEEIQEYMQYLNYKELQKNVFTIVPEDTMDMIKCYHELNK